MERASWRDTGKKTPGGAGTRYGTCFLFLYEAESNDNPLHRLSTSTARSDARVLSCSVYARLGFGSSASRENFGNFGSSASSALESTFDRLRLPFRLSVVYVVP